MSIIQQLSSDNFIVVNKSLARKIGLEEAVIIGELCAEYEYWKREDKLEDEMFYCSISKLENNTGLSERTQRRVIKHLTELNLISTKLKGLPATRYFKLNEDEINKILQSDSSSSCETSELDTANRNSSKNNNIKINNNSNTINSIKEKPKKQSLYSKCVDLIEDYTNNAKLKDVLMNYLRMRLEIKDKPFYTNQFKGMLNKLSGLADNVNDQIDIVQQSIDRGYLGFFEVKKYNNYSRDARIGIENLGDYSIPKAKDDDFRRLPNGEIETF